MGKGIRDRDAACPFYRESTATAIRCDGFYWPKSFLRQTFQEEDDAREQLKLCCGDYRTCELYRAILNARFREEQEAGYK